MFWTTTNCRPDLLRQDRTAAAWLWNILGVKDVFILFLLLWRRYGSDQDGFGDSLSYPHSWCFLWNLQNQRFSDGSAFTLLLIQCWNFFYISNQSQTECLSLLYEKDSYFRPESQENWIQTNLFPLIKSFLIKFRFYFFLQVVHLCHKYIWGKLIVFMDFVIKSKKILLINPKINI